MARSEHKDLNERLVMVTGAGSGIGLALATELARQGCKLLLCDINREACAEVARSLDPDGLRTISAGLDVKDARAIEVAIESAEDCLGPLFGIVTAAGIARPVRAEQATEADWNETIATNLTGTFLCVQAAGRRMLAHGEGSIVTIGSISSLGGQAGRVAYSASKAGVAGLTRVLAVEWGSRNLRVNCVAPAVIDTPMVRRNLPAAFISGVIEDRTPKARLGLPEEVADVCTYLLSEAASFVNGIVMPVCGGLMAGYITHLNGLDFSSNRLMEDPTL